MVRIIPIISKAEFVSPISGVIRPSVSQLKLADQTAEKYAQRETRAENDETKKPYDPRLERRLARELAAQQLEKIFDTSKTPSQMESQANSTLPTVPPKVRTLFPVGGRIPHPTVEKLKNSDLIWKMDPREPFPRSTETCAIRRQGPSGIGRQ
ncbi:hypothetical protein BGX27_003707 [Mortierella sp. AM989]|nr:hypothetical protein BGX27_003707 [Mortierella sp. AM989]